MIFTDLAGTRGAAWADLWDALITRLTSFTNALSGTGGTSQTPHSISTGSKLFALDQATVDMGSGILIRARRKAAPGTFVLGLSTASAAGSVTLDVVSTGGSGGPYTDWIVACDINAGPPLIGSRETDENDTVGAGDHGQAIRVLDPAITSPAAITLTFAAVAVLGDGSWGLIENRSGMAVTLAAAGGQLIDEQASIELPDRGSVLWLVEDGEITIPAARGYGAIAYGWQSEYVDASCIKPRESGGPALNTTGEASTNKNRTDGLDFDGTSIERSWIRFRLPEKYEPGSPLRFRPVVMCSGASNAHTWCLRGVAKSHDDAGDAALGNAQKVTLSNTATGDFVFNKVSADVVLAGSPLPGDMVDLDLFRDPTDSGDTSAVDERLVAVVLYWRPKKATDL